MKKTLAPKPLAPQTRRERNRAEMRAAILDTARAVMRQDGVAALNLNKVAAEIGIKTPSLYEYFDGKMAIYDALFRQGIELFSARMNRVWQTATTWHDSLRAAIETYMQFALDYPELFQLCFERPVPGFAPSEETMQVSWTMLRASDQHIARLIQATAIPSRLSPRQVSDLGIAMMHGLTAQHMANEPHLPVGKGRYGSLIPAAVALFQTAWTQAPKNNAPAKAETKLKTKRGERKK